MFSSALVVLAALCGNVLGQTVYLAGDSTMAKNGAGSGTGTDGWGQYLGQYLSIPVVNNAIAGRSARSFTENGRFDTIINTVKAGDFVVIEFGINDGTLAAGTVDNGRQDAAGDDYNFTATVKDASGNSIVIHTYTYYITNAVNALKAKGAIPIINSHSTRINFSTGAIQPVSIFATWAKNTASRTGVTFIDHGAYVTKQYNVLGTSTVKGFFPNDGTHTSPTAANIVAQAFVRGILCSSSTLKSKVNSAGQSSVPSGCI